MGSEGNQAVDRRPLEQLAKRVDELLTVLNYVAEDLREVADRLKSLVPIVQTQAAQQPPARELTAEEVASAFPEDLRKLLNFEDKGEFITIRPTGFLGSENFAKIADIVRNRFSGDYISAGKDSHFRVSKKQEVVEI